MKKTNICLPIILTSVRFMWTERPLKLEGHYFSKQGLHGLYTAVWPAADFHQTLPNLGLISST